MIGDRIKEARQALGYSAEQVAEFLQVSPTTVYRYENGDISKFPNKLIVPLAKFLCVSPAYLLEWEDVPEETVRQPEPKNDKVRLLINGANKLTQAQLDRAMDMMKIMFEDPNLFERKETDNEERT